MTEAQAKQRLCPWTYNVLLPQQGGGGQTDLSYARKCYGRQCMAWKFDNGDPDDPHNENDQGHCRIIQQRILL